MSLEAFGDEGNVPTRWEDTGMRQEWDTIRARFRKWCADYKSESNDEVIAFVSEITDLMDRLEDEQMSGPF